MLEKSFLEELKEASVSNEPAYVEFFNNKKVRRETKRANDRMTPYYLDDTIGTIKYVFRTGAQTYASNCSYDKIDLGLEIGLMYNAEDVDENDQIKENAKPLDGIVHCYTGNLTSYLNGEQSNERNYYTYSIQGFVKYDRLVSTMKKNGIDFVGPEKFEDFQKAVLAGEPFDISLVADINKDKKQEEDKTQEATKDAPRRLAKIPFFRKKKNK